MSGTRNPRTLWQSYINLPSRTRMWFGVAMGITGIIGLVVADKLQEIFPADRNDLGGASQSQQQSRSHVE